ncbi:MAG: monovalent cation/H(+) antiporter subunit G [Candidatus Bipolaricaulota bacterium]|nr:monovalent cation/H(+) antiporter subunit G [Candidatus Bipolaricaulota bacterium]
MIAGVLIGFGLLFVAIGTVGIIRFRDIYSRLQASGVSDNAGLSLILLGLIARGGIEQRDLILAFLLLLLLVTNPLVTHSIAKSAFTQRHTGKEGG